MLADGPSRGLGAGEAPVLWPLTRRLDSLEKTDAGRDWGQEEKGTTEEEMAGWCH